MEGLQDAIQDAQYMGEMCEDTPLPMTRLVLPLRGDVDNYYDKLKLQKRSDLSFLGILKQHIGYYFFAKFVRKQGDDESINFLTEVEHYRVLTRDNLRVEYAKDIIGRFTRSTLVPNNQIDNTTTANNNKLNVFNHTDTAILYRRGRSHRFACIRHMEKDKNLINKVNAVLQIEENTISPPTNNTADATTSSSVTTSIAHHNDNDMTDGVGIMLSNQVVTNTESKKNARRSLAGVTGNVIEKIFKEFDFLEDAIIDVYDLKEKAVKKAASSHDLLYETKKIPVQLFDFLQAVVLEKIRKKYFHLFEKSSEFIKYLQYKMLSEQKLVESDFAIFRKLGRGGFGAVYACKRMDTGRLYAMKVMNKRRLKEKKAFKVLKHERKILEKLDSPFLVCMSYSFQTDNDVVLILDLMQGGDLQFHLSNRSKQWPMDRVQFWAAQIALGLEHLHENNIVYRDLKPENVLLDQYGNCCISDFGLACQMSSIGLKGRCGTRGFWAPEMLKSGEKYFLTVDWWSFGCLVYALIHGKSPFRTTKAKTLKKEKNESIDYAILNMEVEYPEKEFTEDSSDLISKLLDRNPKKRLGHGGAVTIKKHIFFQSINWGMLATGNVEPPFIPDRDINAASQDDIGEFTKSKAELTPDDIQMFKAMDFTSSSNVQKEFVDFLQYEDEHGPVELQKEVDVGCCNVM
jgi:serine/threonine protein kinase